MTKPQLCLLVWPVSDLLTWRGGVFISNTAASHKGAASFGFEVVHAVGFILRVSEIRVEVKGLTLTMSHSATCLSLMRLKPVLRTLSLDTNTARTGLLPS